MIENPYSTTRGFALGLDRFFTVLLDNPAHRGARHRRRFAEAGERLRVLPEVEERHAVPVVPERAARVQGHGLGELVRAQIEPVVHFLGLGSAGQQGAYGSANQRKQTTDQRAT